MAEELTRSIRIYEVDYTRILGIAARLERERNRRVSLPEVIEAVIDKYPKLTKKGK